ncbi:zf-HC2 domain-containing protein [Actinopolyspora erythraea]|uniref:zf-HC2 domain-containing protein n=1 Tax=Actinopolyspora erythraea TaxID=414996 RepID=UPI000A70A05A|nr:zf-HC2 domain-containing protein [Actinopolyspora erythraea]
MTSVEILSAELDGATTEEESRRARRHLEGCAECRLRHDRFRALHRAVRVMPAESGPDVTDAVLPALRPRRLDRLRGEAGGRARVLLRWALALVAVLQLAVALLQLTGVEIRVGAETARTTMPHIDHETGAWNAAVAVGLAWVALRARHAAAHLPVLASFTGVLGALCLLDLLTGRVGFERVVSHLPVLLGLVLVAVLALLNGPHGTPAPAARASSDTGPGAGEVPEPAEAEVEPLRSSPPPVARRESA